MASNLTEEVRDLSIKLVRLQEDVKATDALLQSKLRDLAMQMSKDVESDTDVWVLPPEIEKLRGKTGDAVRIIYADPDRIWRFQDLFDAAPGFSSVNSLNTALTQMVERSILAKEDRVGFRAHPDFVKQMKRGRHKHATGENDDD